MRLAIAGFLHESNTFNPIKTDKKAFEAQSLAFGDRMLAEWADAHHEMGGFLESAKVEVFEPIPLFMAWAMPAGPVTDSVFDEIVAFLVRRVREEKPDGLLLALHGAMVAESHLDADGETVTRLRQAIGRDMPLAVTLDLHGNISQRLIDACDIVVAYRTNPHVDQRECGRRAARLLTRMVRGEIRPRVALAKPPMILNIMAQDTSRDPLKGFMERARAMESEPGILAASLLPGFAYADVPQMGPAVVVVADGDAKLAQRKADELGDALWQDRENFNVPLPEADAAVAKALQAERRPVVLVDSGDNVGGGSAADGTVVLAELLRQGATESVVCLFDPESVRRCVAAGVGAELTLDVGGKVDDRHGKPLRVTGRVRVLHDGDYLEPQVRHGGKRLNHMGLSALVELSGSNLLVLTSMRHPPFSLGQLTCMGLRPELQRILVVKAAIAYKAAYAPVAGTIIEMDTPGTTAVNPHRFTYRHIRRPLYPLA